MMNNDETLVQKVNRMVGMDNILYRCFTQEKLEEISDKARSDAKKQRKNVILNNDLESFLKTANSIKRSKANYNLFYQKFRYSQGKDFMLNMLYLYINDKIGRSFLEKYYLCLNECKAEKNDERSGKNLFNMYRLIKFINSESRKLAKSKGITFLPYVRPSFEIPFKKVYNNISGFNNMLIQDRY